MRRDTGDALDQLIIDKWDSEFETPGHAHNIAVAQQLIPHVSSNLKIAYLILQGWLWRHIHRHLRFTVDAFTPVSREQLPDFFGRKDSAHGPISRRRNGYIAQELPQTIRSRRSKL